MPDLQGSARQGGHWCTSKARRARARATTALTFKFQTLRCEMCVCVGIHESDPLRGILHKFENPSKRVATSSDPADSLLVLSSITISQAVQALVEKLHRTKQKIRAGGPDFMSRASKTTVAYCSFCYPDPEKRPFWQPLQFDWGCGGCSQAHKHSCSGGAQLVLATRSWTPQKGSQHEYVQTKLTGTSETKRCSHPRPTTPSLPVVVLFFGVGVPSRAEEQRSFPFSCAVRWSAVQCKRNTEIL